MEPRQIMLEKKSKKKGTLKSDSMGALENDTRPFLEDKTHKAKRTRTRDLSRTGMLQMIAGYLKKNGFSNTLSAFLSEAQIEVQVDSSQAHSMDLEDPICKYLEASYSAEAALTDLKEQGNNEETNVDASGKLLHGKKREKHNGSGTEMTIESENFDQILREPLKCAKDSAEMPLSDEPDNISVKSKEKKKKRKTNRENGDLDKVDTEKLEKFDAENTDHDILSGRSVVKSKEENKKQKSISQMNEELVVEKSKDLGSLEGANKMDSQHSKSVLEAEVPLDGSDLISKEKKKNKSICEGSHTEITGNKQISSDVETSKDLNRTGSYSKESNKIDSKKVKSDVEPEVKKKKKHRLISKENGEVAEQLDHGKRKEENNQTESKELTGQLTEGSKRKANKSEKATMAEQPEEEKKDGCSSVKKIKEANCSSEPRTVNAFQRVKVDEVEFVDERLQDNSYWAKSGADNGYGARAEEVLGQVRGRDFRHEKTKKKRGSYRGGQIDLQSHSIKFNYSDEE